MIKFSYTNTSADQDKYQLNLAQARLQADEIISDLTTNLKYKIFDFPSSYKELTNIAKIAKNIKNPCEDIIIIGMGGAILNPQALLTLHGLPKEKNIHFLGNTDPIYFQNLAQKINLKHSIVIVISNSGNTLETISLSQMMIKMYENTITNSIGEHFFFITNTINGKLKEIANNIKATIIPHRAGISGRFSGFTNVSTFIASIAGLDVAEYIKGAEYVLEDFISNKHAPSIIAAANIMTVRKPIMVNLAYLQQFDPFLEWYCQIIAESLGKNNHAITPIRGLGPNDQHSTLQLYIEGADDKFYNFLHVTHLDFTKNIDLSIFSYLYKINNINFTATKEVLESIGRPVRSIILPNLSLRTIGELTANMMLETIILCKMSEVNPFDQPGVELIKIKTKELL
ncbi:MAG: hypothetical protein H6909_04815 [Rickettsiaceae bacterium]|nr:hypothetical protein [Rickettsiaceae bacterium]